MSEKVKIPKFTSDQRDFVMGHLASETPYAEIVDEFLRMYPYFSESFDEAVVRKTLNDRLRKLKSDHSEELLDQSEDGESPLIPITCPYYRLRYIDRMLHETPDIEVVAYDGNGNPKKKSNRSEKLKMLELAERIFEKMLGIEDSEVRENMPTMVPSNVLGPPPDQSSLGDGDVNS